VRAIVGGHGLKRPAKRMGFKKIGIAHCISFVDETLMMSQGKCDLQSKPM